MNLQPKALVVGYGSIGRLHARILEGLGFATAIVTKHAANFPNAFPNIESAFSRDIEYVVVASETSKHETDVRRLNEFNFSGKVLVEKPLFMHPVPQDLRNVRQTFVGYNLRYHPAVLALRKALRGRIILTVHHYVGQHLSQWRPTSNHLDSYSAHKARGGGVLRDLSHELDLMSFLFGTTNTVHAIGGKFGDVTVDSEDAFGVVMRNENCPLITLQMNYLDHFGGRTLKVVCQDTSFDVDFSVSTLRVGDETQTIPCVRETSYKAMHQDILFNDGALACTYAEGQKIVEMINELERS